MDNEYNINWSICVLIGIDLKSFWSNFLRDSAFNARKTRLTIFWSKYALNQQEKQNEELIRVLMYCIQFLMFTIHNFGSSNSQVSLLLLRWAEKYGLNIKIKCDYSLNKWKLHFKSQTIVNWNEFFKNKTRNPT